MLGRIWLKLFRRRRLHDDMREEMAFHREMARAAGNPIPFGNAAVVQENALDLWRFVWIENLWRDLRLGVRNLRRNPALVVASVLSLGLGIGVNLTLFSLATEFLMSVPSVTDAGRVIRIRLGGNSHADYNVVQFVRDAEVFEQVTGLDEDGHLNWNDGLDTRLLFGVVTEKNFFAAMGVPVALGRGFRTDDPDEVVVLHHRFWQTRMNGDPAVLGRTLNLEGKRYEVIGVLPESHRTLVGLGYSPDVYVPKYLKTGRLGLYARLKHGQSLESARLAAEAVGVRLDAALPDKFVKYAEFVQAEPVAGLRRLNRSLKSAGIFMALLMALAGLVLLIACVNVAGILLAHASARQREIAIRVSLGAGRGRLLQQLLSESLLLAAMGTATGLLLARLTSVLLSNLSLPLSVPLRVIVNTDWRMVAYALALAAVTTIVCGLLPALQCVRESMTPDLHRHTRQRIRRFLVSLQVAMSMVLLVTGFLFLRNTLKTNAVDPGFDFRNTLRASVNLPPLRYSQPSQALEYVNRALQAIEATPGVDVAAGVANVPFTGGSTRGGEIVFSDNDEHVRMRANLNWVTAGYFRAMSIGLASGRTFIASDAGQDAVVVNRSFVKRFMGKRSPVGTTFHWDGGPPLRIVGVAEDTKSMMIGEVDEAQIYEMWSGGTRLNFVVKSSLAPATQVEPLRRVLRDVEPGASNEIQPMNAAIGFAFLPSQLGAGLMGAIGLVGLLLVVVGLYGTLAYTVSRRLSEFAVRLAIGASRGDVTREVLWDSLRLVTAGGAVGLGIAYFVTKPLAIFLIPGFSTSDPVSFTVVPIVMALIGLLAAVSPARRAASVDPASALRVS